MGKRRQLHVLIVCIAVEHVTKLIKISVRKFLLTSGIVQYGHSARQRDVTRAGGIAKPFTDFDNAAASLFLDRQRRVAIQ